MTIRVLLLQDARAFGKTGGPTAAPFRDVLNLHAAYAELGDARTGAVTRASAGRSSLSVKSV